MIVPLKFPPCLYPLFQFRQYSTTDTSRTLDSTSRSNTRYTLPLVYSLSPSSSFRFIIKNEDRPPHLAHLCSSISRSKDLQVITVTHWSKVTQRFHLANWVIFSLHPFFFSFNFEIGSLTPNVHLVHSQADNGGIAMYNSYNDAKKKGLVKVDKSGAVQLKVSTKQYQGLRDSVRLVSKQT